jgi:hypothetical protein
MQKKKYQIFDTCWHVSHQSDMIHALKDDCDFHFCLNTKRQWSDSKISGQRPIPENLKFVTHYEPGKYDVAILHIDQQVMSAHHQKRMIYEQFNAIITDIPKIVINHGTPVYPDGYPLAMRETMSPSQMQDDCIANVRSLMGNNIMVVNSHTSASEQEWGFGIPIVHGIDPEAWLDLPKEPRVFTALSSIGLDTYYNRQCLNDVSDILQNTYGYTLWHAKVNISTDTALEKYKDFLGRSLLYLDVSYRTPMNRARTEAFLSGCCVVQVAGAHDLGKWAKPGENIVLVANDPDEIAKVVVDFLENRYSEALKIGKNGKTMALNEFNPERYRQDWLKLIRQVTKKN